MGARNADLLGRYVWLLDIIRSHGRITFDEINECWKRSHLGYGDNLPWRTFMNHKKAIADVFNVNIECDLKDGYKYYIENPEDLEGDGLRSWLVDSYATLNQLQADSKLEHRILFEEIPSGTRFLTRILEAMRFDAVLEVTHQGFGKNFPSVFEVEPYALKVFNRRWYLIGRSPYYDQVRIYGLDRILNVVMTDKKFQMPKDFDIKEFFKGCIGIIADKDTDIEQVVVQVFGYARKYLATLPIHSSQREIARDDKSVTYAYEVRPNYEFFQALLMQADQVKVLSPKWVSEEIQHLAAQILSRYKD